jgi:hypothetical protein
MSTPTGDRKYWLDAPENIRKIFYALIAVDVLLLVGGELIHKHGHFDIELNVPGFYAIFGFFAYCSIIAGAVTLRKFVKREEDYYGE